MALSKVCSSSVIIFLLAFSMQVSAQSGVTDVSTGMLTWVKHLNNDLDKYCTREKAPDLARNFEDLKQDLTIYMKRRKALSDSLFRNNIKPGKKDNDNLEDLRTKMNIVTSRMRNVTDLASNELRKEGDRLNEEIYDVLYGEPGRYLSSLEAFLDGRDVTKKDLAVDGSAHYQRLEECITIITGIQGKIDKKIR